MPVCWCYKVRLWHEIFVMLRPEGEIISRKGILGKILGPCEEDRLYTFNSLIASREWYNKPLWRFAKSFLKLL